MPNIVVAGDLWPFVGTPAFMPSLLSYIRNSSSGTLPLDPVIFQAVLLCILAGEKHLLLHTPEEDVGLVVRLAAWILSAVFDLTTHKSRIKPQLEVGSRSTAAASSTDRSPFLRSLFLCSDRDEFTQTPGKSKVLSSRNERSPSRSKKSGPTQFSRLVSSPDEFLSRAMATSQRPDNRSSGQQPHPSSRVGDPFSSPSTASTFTPRSPVLHSHTDPTPSRQRPKPGFPHALVVSGLEHAHVLDQRALAQALLDKRVVLEGRALQPSSGLTSGRPAGARQGRESFNNKSTPSDDTEGLDDADYNGVWNIPEGFITIYVCPWDTRERPNIHKTLLDRFAMSTTVMVRKSVRQAMRALQPPSGYLPTTSMSQTPLSGSPLHHHHGYRYAHIAAPPLVAKQLLPPDFLHSLRARCRRTYIAPVLSIYLADLFSAARHHPQLDGTFLTVKVIEDAQDLVRAGRVLGMDPTGSELVRNPEYPFTEDEYLNENDEESSQSRFNDSTDDTGSGSVNIETATNGIHPDFGVQDNPVSPGAGAKDHQVEPEPLYVSEADIARIVPRVITHRLRVRDGPQDEVLSSAICGATFGNCIDGGRDDAPRNMRSTVKDILVSILGDV